MQVNPSPNLKNRSSKFGLNDLDFIILALVYLGLCLLLNGTRYVVLSVIPPAILYRVLRNLRMNHRRKVIRDKMAHFVCSRRVYVPKASTRACSHYHISE